MDVRPHGTRSHCMRVASYKPHTSRYRIRRRATAWLFLLAAAGSCGPSPSSDPLDALRIPELTLTELSHVGGTDERETYMLSSVPAAAVLDPDTWALIDYGSKQVRVYGTDGIVRRVLGSEGKGPGQFSQPLGLGVPGNGDVLVWDMMSRRIATFDSAGRLGATGTLPTADFTAVFSSVFVGALSDGSWVLQEGASPLSLQGAPDGPRRDTVRFSRISPKGEQLGQIASVMGAERVVMHSEGRSGEQIPILGRQLVASLSGDTLLVGVTDSLRLLRFLPDGTALPPLTFQRPPRPATEKDIATERAQRVSRAEALPKSLPSSFPKAAVEKEVKRMVDLAKNVPAESTLPAFEGLKTGPGGDLWVRDASPPDVPTTRWIRFNSTFRPEGWIELPEKAVLLGVGDGMILVSTRDDMDLPTVTCYRVETPEGA